MKTAKEIQREEARKDTGLTGITIPEETAIRIMIAAEFSDSDKLRAEQGCKCWLLGTVGIAKLPDLGWALIDRVSKES